MIATDKETATAGSRLPLPRILRCFWAASVGLFLLMLVVRWLELRAGFPPSFYHFLGPWFADLLEYVPSLRLLHTAEFYRNPVTPSVAYPPLGAVLFALLYSFGQPVALYLAMAALWMGACVWGVRRRLMALGINAWESTLFPATVVLLAFPVFGLLQSGNLELFVWIFAATGLWMFLRGRDNPAAVLWGLAAGIKLYPIIFLALLLPRRRFGALAVGVLTFVAASVLAMRFMGPTIAVAWHGSLQNVFGYQGVRVGEWNLHELGTNHSVFGLAKLAATIVGFPLAKLTLPYYAAGAVVFAVVFFGRVRKLPVANQALTVSVFMVMLPPVSYFYTLVHLLAPWLLLVFLAVRADRNGVRVPGLNVTLCLFLPLFASFTLFTFPSVLLFGGLVQAFVLMLLFVCSATFPLREERTGV